MNKILAKFDINIDGDSITSLSNQLNTAKENEIVFYQLSEGDSAYSKFQERLQKSKSKIVIVMATTKYQNTERCFFFDEKKYFELRDDLCDFIYPIKKELKFLGVTGTNGKTSTVNFISEVLRINNINVATMGTLGLYLNGRQVKDLGMTTPDYIDLRKSIDEVQQDVEVFALEVSSHGLEQNRLGNIKLDGAAWTNFTQDHLDYHQTMDEYFKSKKKIIHYMKDNEILVPNDNYSFIKDLEHEFKVTKVNCDFNFRSKYFEIKYQKENLQLAIALCEKIGFQVNKNIEKVQFPEGRFEIIEKRNKTFIVDYAHTPDALEKLLTEIKKNLNFSELTVVFGCGGDRDRSKRKLMGEVVNRYSDRIIITNDNPRTEDPNQIVEDIKEGITKDYFCLLDREEAIGKAEKITEDSGIIVIAGKGHEKYQDMNGVKSYFSDQEVVRNLND